MACASFLRLMIVAPRTALQESQSTAEDQAALAELFFNFLLQFA